MTDGLLAVSDVNSWVIKINSAIQCPRLLGEAIFREARRLAATLPD